MTTLILFLFFSFSLLSSPSYEKDSLVMVEGCVHALTGDLILSGQDIEEFPLNRVYISQEGKWNFVPHCRLVLYGTKIKDKDKKKKKKKDKDKDKYIYEKAKVYEPNGCPIIYYHTGEGNYTLQLPRGFTNTARGTIGARNDLKNQKLFRNDTFSFTLTTPNGTKRVYKKAYIVDHDLFFLLSHEELPNGNIYTYEYDQQHRVYNVRFRKSSCRFVNMNQNDFDIECSTGEKVSYRFSMQKDTWQLKRVTANHTEEEFDYCNNRLSKWKTPEGRILCFEYTHDGKIASIQKGNGDLLYEFHYFANRTDVIDTNGQKTTYLFSSTLFPEKIFSSKETLEFQWDKDGKISSQLRKNLDGEILESKQYIYDQKGNPITEITEEETISRKFDILNRITKIRSLHTIEYEYWKNTDLISAKFLKSGESILRTFYQYDENHTLVKVTIDDGPKQTYKRVIEIEGGPHRPTSVIEKADAALLKKTSYQYTNEGIIEEIYDADGSLCLKRPTSISGIHRPWEKTIPIGISIEDGYEIKRDYFGRVISKRLYDSSGMLLEEETWTYNALHLLSTKDKTGLITDYSYNREGRKVREVIHSNRGNIEKSFAYDSKGRLERLQDGELLTLYRYDDEDRVIEKQKKDLEENTLQKFTYAYEAGNTIVTHFSSHGQAIYPLKKNAVTATIRELPGVHYTYDAKGKLIELKSEDKTIHYSLQYNKRDQPILIVDHINSTSGRRIYDDLGNLIEETFLNGYTIQSQYDLKSRKIHFVLPDSSEVYYKWGPQHLDEIYRITEKGKYEYRHNFIHYDLAGFPTKQRLIEGFGELSFEIDNDLCVSAINSRHMTQRCEDLEPYEFEATAKEYNYICDALGRIIYFEQPTRKIYYTYDAWNRRMSKRVRELIHDEWTETLYIHFLYDEDKEVGAMDVEEGWLRHFRVLAPHPINPGDQAVVYELEGMPYVPLHDLHGNVKKLLSVIRRKVMEMYDFSYSGKEKISDYWGDEIPISKANNPWRFRSSWVDEETGLIYIDKDYYDPIKKIFLGNQYHFLERPNLYQLPHETEI